MGVGITAGILRGEPFLCAIAEKEEKYLSSTIEFAVKWPLL